MSKPFKSMKELEAYINKQAKLAMSKNNSNTANLVVETGKEKVQSEVYDVYDPKQYERTGQLKESWNVTETEGGIAVENVRHDEETGKNVAYTVEYGEGYDYDFEYSNKPRRFTEAAREELRGSKKLKDALAKDLRDSGFDVR